MILDIELLKKILPEIAEFSDGEKFKEQVFSVMGFDEATIVVENVRGTKFPCVLIEDSASGYIGFNSGFCDNRTVGIWVLNRANDTSAQERNRALRESYALGRKIMRQLIFENSKYDGTGTWIDFGRTTYIPVGPFAGNVFGYEFMFMTKEEIDLEL